MPLRDDILNPIPGDNPSGENLRYAPVYDKIKEARRQDDDAPQGEWQRERKVADYGLVIKLGQEAVASKSKDLQLAAWLTEALLNKEGYAGLHQGLSLVRGLIENFWDTVYPELDEGDAEFRAAPLEWVGQYLGLPCKKQPLTKAGYDFLKYHESRKVGYEADIGDYGPKADAWKEARADGKLSADEWDKAFAATPKTLYVKIVGDLEACLTDIEELQPICEEKFGDVAPSFSKLRDSLEEVRHTTNQLLNKKREVEPDEPVEGEAVEDSSWASEEAAPDAVVESTGTAAAVRRAPSRMTSAEPADRDDAINRVAAAAAFIRREDPSHPAAYLLLRGLRWGELRAGGATLDPLIFDAPATEVRQALKRNALEGNWAEVLEVGEAAMAKPCGRAWLDLQRYVVTACDNLGHAAVAEAIKAELRALVRDYPDLPTSTLMDDTPTANAETQAWLKEFADAAGAGGESSAAYQYQYQYESSEPQSHAESNGDAPAAPPDTFELAMECVRGGRPQEAIEMLVGEIGRQNSGRGKFQRKLQLSQVCLSIGHEEIAFSILEEIATTIDRHQLEEWETHDTVAHALSMLYSCLKKREVDQSIKQKLYARICRLDPAQALAQMR